MDRRGFFGALAAVAGGLVLPERERVYSFMPATWTPHSTQIPILFPEPRWPNVVVVTSAEQFRELLGYPPPHGLFDPPKFIPIRCGFFDSPGGPIG